MPRCVRPVTPSIPLVAADRASARWSPHRSLLVTKIRTRSPRRPQWSAGALAVVAPRWAEAFAHLAHDRFGDQMGNSLTPLFMRHGSVQPLRVTTGLYDRPELGTSGGMVVGLFWSTGSEALPTRGGSPHR